MKDAFGWEGAEHVQQHDIEEAMKIIFDTFERALFGTEYEKNIKELFRYVLTNAEEYLHNIKPAETAQ